MRHEWHKRLPLCGNIFRGSPTVVRLEITDLSKPYREEGSRELAITIAVPNVGVLPWELHDLMWSLNQAPICALIF